MSNEGNRCNWRRRWSTTTSTQLRLGSSACTHPLDEADPRMSVSISQWHESPHNVPYLYLETDTFMKRRQLHLEPRNSHPRQVQISIEFLKFPLGRKWIKLYKWTNLPRLMDMAGGGIRGCQLLLSHLGRKPSSEVLCVVLWSLQLLSHLSCQEQLNSSTILLTLCKGKYILPKVDFADPGYFTISVNSEILLSGHIFLPINLGSVICCPRRKSLLC